jgi:cellulose synthase/poly-beta-1,6-N-acetylglucosamine synthase-like glycosyltransferase
MAEWVVIFNWFVLIYFLVLGAFQLSLILIAAADIARALRWSPTDALDDQFANPLTPGVSVLMPAYNEEAGIVEAVTSLLMLRYPLHEVVIVDDGSTDRTFEVVRDHFDLREIERAVEPVTPVIGAVESVWVSRNENLTLIRKKNAGRRADALNVALRYAAHPLVCMVDADSILEESALLHVVKPFLDDPERVMATGGVVRPANGVRVEAGRVVSVRAPERLVERVQVVEYLRAFLLSRAGWSRIGGLLIISGAFGLFRKDVLLALGGLDASTLAEDADLVAAIHRYAAREGLEHAVVFVPQPVSWTEVPTSVSVLARQRRRWSQGLIELLVKFRTMIGNPRYGSIGVLAFPFYLAFEALGPIVELAGLIGLALAAWLGVLNVPFMVLFLIAAVLLGSVLSIAAVCVEQLAFHRYSRYRDLLSLILAAFAENLGYRQLHAWWRIQGLLRAIRGGNDAWGSMPRAGFAGREPADTPDSASRGGSQLVS